MSEDFSKVTDLSDVREDIGTEGANIYAARIKDYIKGILATLEDAEKNVEDPQVLKRLLDTLTLRMNETLLDKIVDIEIRRKLDSVESEDVDE